MFSHHVKEPRGNYCWCRRVCVIGYTKLMSCDTPVVTPSHFTRICYKKNHFNDLTKQR